MRTRDLFLRFEQIISSTDPVWYGHNSEAKQILQLYITDEQELFRILWNAWKDCV